MFIPTQAQLTEANGILRRLAMITDMVRKRAIEEGKDPEEAVTVYHCSPGYSLGRLQARVLMNGGFASFKCLFHGNDMVAWEKVSIDGSKGRSRMWSLMPEYAKKFNKSVVAAGNTSNDIRNMGLCEKETFLPAIVREGREPHRRPVVRVDDMEMEYSGF